MTARKKSTPAAPRGRKEADPPTPTALFAETVYGQCPRCQQMRRSWTCDCPPYVPGDRVMIGRRKGTVLTSTPRPARGGQPAYAMLEVWTDAGLSMIRDHQVTRLVPPDLDRLAALNAVPLDDLPKPLKGEADLVEVVHEAIMELQRARAQELQESAERSQELRERGPALSFTCTERSIREPGVHPEPDPAHPRPWEGPAPSCGKPSDGKQSPYRCRLPRGHVGKHAYSIPDAPAADGPLQVPCSQCGAQVGQKCTNWKDQPCAPHRDRKPGLACNVEAPSGGNRGPRRCTRAPGHTGKHHYVEPAEANARHPAPGGAHAAQADLPGSVGGRLPPLPPGGLDLPVGELPAGADDPGAGADPAVAVGAAGGAGEPPPARQHDQPGRSGERRGDRAAVAAGLVLIWSNEHKSWWRPDGMGYTSDRSEAGVYTRADAERRTRPGYAGRLQKLNAVEAEREVLRAEVQRLETALQRSREGRDRAGDLIGETKRQLAQAHRDVAFYEGRAVAAEERAAAAEARAQRVEEQLRSLSDARDLAADQVESLNDDNERLERERAEFERIAKYEAGRAVDALNERDLLRQQLSEQHILCSGAAEATALRQQVDAATQARLVVEQRAADLAAALQEQAARAAAAECERNQLRKEVEDAEARTRAAAARATAAEDLAEVLRAQLQDAERQPDQDALRQERDELVILRDRQEAALHTRTAELAQAEAQVTQLRPALARAEKRADKAEHALALMRSEAATQLGQMQQELRTARDQLAWWERQPLRLTVQEVPLDLPAPAQAALIERDLLQHWALEVDQRWRRLLTAWQIHPRTRPCDMCKDPKVLNTVHQCCKKCGARADGQRAVIGRFGWRLDKQAGVLRSQSQCRKGCRSGKPAPTECCVGKAAELHAGEASP